MSNRGSDGHVRSRAERHGHYEGAILVLVVVALCGVGGLAVGVAVSRAASAGGTGAHSALVLRVRLSRTTAPADGESIPATLTVINDSGHPVVTPSRCSLKATSGPAGWIQIGLTNARVPYQPAWDADMCAPSARLPVGTSAYATVVSTAWYECGGGPPTPRCTGRPGMPPLRAGTYTVKVEPLFPVGAAWRSSTTVKVHLVKPSTTTGPPADK